MLPLLKSNVGCICVCLVTLYHKIEEVNVALSVEISWMLAFLNRRCLTTAERLETTIHYKIEE